MPAGSNPPPPPPGGYYGESYSPPPQCGPNEYYDWGMKQCKQSAYHEAQPSCGPNEYYDWGRKACAQPTYREPPRDYQGGYEQGGYPGQPYGNESAPDHRYEDRGYDEWRQQNQDPCFEKMDSVRGEMEAFRMSMDSKARAFHEGFAEARMEFGRQRHTPEEWRQFTESYMGQGKSLFEDAKAELEAKIKAAIGEDCFARMGPMMGGPDNAGPFTMPNFGGGPGMGPGGMEDRFAHMPPPPPPMPEDDARFRLNDEADKIRIECERRVWEFIGPPPHEAEAFEKWQAEHPEPPSQDDHRKAMEIWRECEKKIRATFHDEFERPENEDDVEDFSEQFGSLDMFFDEESGMIIVQGRHLAFKGNPESQMMEDFTCQGALFIEQAFVNGLLEEFTPEDTGEGTALMIYDANEDRVLGLHDNPRCVINAAATGEIPSITLDLADHLEVEKTESGDYRFTDGEVDGSVLLHGAEVELEEGNRLVITGKATFLVKNKEAVSESLGGSAYEEAIEDKKIGAEIKIAADDGDLAVDATPLGDLETDVEGGEDKVTVTIDSEEGVGKTVVLEIEKDVFASDVLEVSVVGVDEDGNEEDLKAKESSDLNDILDPLDDGEDGVEYWIVEDKNGFHVLVSFPHFSEKKVTVQSAEAESGESKDSLIPGFEGALLMAALGLSLLVVGLRRRDE